MRAGPETGFPRIVTLPAGAAVTVYGCSYGWSWCDTGWRSLAWLGQRALPGISLRPRHRVATGDVESAIGIEETPEMARQPEEKVVFLARH
jgi:hypothetical protein